MTVLCFWLYHKGHNELACCHGCILFAVLIMISAMDFVSTVIFYFKLSRTKWCQGFCELHKIYM